MTFRTAEEARKVQEMVCPPLIFSYKIKPIEFQLIRQKIYFLQRLVNWNGKTLQVDMAVKRKVGPI